MRKRRVLRAEGTQGMVPSERRSWGQRERAGDAASDVALLVRSGLRG